MLLCDIGNTSYHFYDGENQYKKSVLDFDPTSLKEKIYFISVNKALESLLLSLQNWINLSNFIDRSRYYESMGIDRVVALETTSNAVIVDAGSAITVDVVRDGLFEGGFIYPGLKAMHETYKRISPALNYEFNFDLDLENLAKNSQDAISYGVLKLLYSEVLSYELPVILTGGDASSLKRVFLEATVEDRLIFKGMQNIIEREL